MRGVRIFGAGVRAKVAADLIAWQFQDQLSVVGYYDDRLPAGTRGPCGQPILGTVGEGIDALATSGDFAFLALGTLGSSRAFEIMLELRSRGITPVSLVARGASVSPSAILGCNAIVPPGAYVGASVTIGNMFTAHGGVAIEHDCTIGDNVLVAPGVALASRVVVESHCFLGVGTQVSPTVRIGAGTLVGAGSLVTKDLPPHVIAYGRPAIAVRDVAPGDEVPVRAAIEALARRS